VFITNSFANFAASLDLLWACCILFVVGVVYEWVKSTRISLFHTRNHWLFRRCGWIKEKSKSKQIILAPQVFLFLHQIVVFECFCGKQLSN